MKPRLIVIDGVDSSGKETQTRLLCDRLTADGYKVRRITFPDYESDSSALVKMYLAGEFGTEPTDVNPFAASTFFAVDRFASYKKDWGADLDSGIVIIADRYVSSNMIHQAGKIDSSADKHAFAKWLDDLEYTKFGLPRPLCTIFLDMPVEFAIKLMAERVNKITGEATKDIHEGNIEYLTKSYNNAVDVARLMNWEHIRCVKDRALRSIEEINNEIYNIAINSLKYI